MEDQCGWAKFTRAKPSRVVMYKALSRTAGFKAVGPRSLWGKNWILVDLASWISHDSEGC